VARGEALMEQGRYGEAERVFRQAVSASQGLSSANTLLAATALTRLATCLKSLARFSEAGPLYQQALVIAERASGRESAAAAAIYRELAALEHAAGNWARGVPFARTAVRIRRRALGARHPELAGDMMTLAALLDGQRDYRKSERLYARAIAILEPASAAHPDIAVALINLAAIQQARRRSKQAERLYRRALAMDEAHFGPGHPRVAFCTNNLAVLLAASGRATEAVKLFRSALSTFRQTFGASSPNVGRCLENYAEALRTLGRRKEALACARRAERILGRMEVLNDEGVAATATINPQMARFRLIVRPSAISRFGVFAEEPIPPRRRIIEYTGERIGGREALRRADPLHNYLFALDRKWIDGAIGGSGAEYVNHSCEPNVRARKVHNRIRYYSLRAIAKGEELTIDYRFPTYMDRVPCGCGAASCRGTINLTGRAEPQSGSGRRSDRSRRRGPKKG